MRILFTSWAWPTHYLTLVSLGWALRAAGHEVRVAAPPSLAPTILASGLDAVPAGREVDAVAMVREFAPKDSDTSVTSLRKKGAAALRMYATIADAMVDDVISYGRAWGAQAIVYEPTTYAGSIAAAVLGVPAVRHLWAADFTHRAHSMEPEAFGPLYARLGLSEVETFGDLTVDPCPPSMQIPVEYPRQPVRYVPYNGPGTVPAWLHEPPSRPRVCLTWGQTNGQLFERAPITGTLLELLAECDVEVVAAVSAADREPTRAAAPHARVVEQLPLHLLLPTCSLLVQQGGPGTTLTAAAAGVPQLLIPDLPDRQLNARQLAATGAGAYLAREEAERPEALRDRLEELLGDPSYRDAAARLREAMNAQPTLAEAVRRIEQLVASHHTKEAACAS